jgi:ComB9 competence protein
MRGIRFTILGLFTCLGFSLELRSSDLNASSDVKDAAAVINQAALEANHEDDATEGNREIEQQHDGKFPRLERQHSLGAIQHSWDKASEAAGIYKVTYSQQTLIKLRLREFMTTTVVFPSWEEIDDIIVGDKSTFEASKKSSHILLLKPKDFIGADSNITVLGRSGLVYTFYVRSEGYNSVNLPDLRVHVHVPGDIPLQFPGQSPLKKEDVNKRGDNPSLQQDRLSHYTENYPQTLPPKMDRLNFKWSMAGDQTIAPRQVFSDGVRTWFNFDDGTDKKIEAIDLPVVSRVLDGVDTPINTRIEGSLIVAEATGVFTLKSGNLTTCVYPTDLVGDKS